MVTYVFKRLVQMIPLIIIISMIAFGIIRIAEKFAKADPIAALRMNPTTTEATIQREIARLGLNEPLYKRYWNWGSRFAMGDMGDSYYFKAPVNSLISERVSNTLILGISSLLLTWLIAIPLGIYLAVRQYSMIDQIMSSLSYFFMGFPDFFLAILLLLFAAKTGLFPISGMTSVENNHMAKIKSVYAGKYEHSPNAKVSEDQLKYEQEIREKAEKDDLVKTLVKDLEIELLYGDKKASTISNSTSVLESIAKLDQFPKDLESSMKAELDSKKAISKDTANNALKALDGMVYFTSIEKFKYVMNLSGRIAYHYSKYVPDVLYHLVLPTITLSIISIAGLQRRMRANLLDVLNDEYIRTARAKGLPENVVIYKHAVRNALNPMVTLLGFELAGLLSGAAFVEILFSWPGLGQMMLDALLGNDLNLVMAGLLISAIMLLLGNLLSDLLLAFTDPRIKLEA
jgi:ABC-type dipeptide/oligopeptide/nickel transport system permease component